MSAIDDLLTNYRERVARPWQDALAGPQRVWFVIYDPRDERRLRLRLHDFEAATLAAGHGWRPVDLTDAFPRWLGAHDYREEYFASPEYIANELPGFADEVAGTVRQAVAAAGADDVVAVTGVGSLFKLASVSGVVSAVSSGVRGRLVVFYPGHDDSDRYLHLLGGKEGWNYLAVRITATR